MILTLLTILVYCSFESTFVEATEMEIGNAIDLFKNYGLLMRIFPVDENHSEFMENEFSSNVFDRLTISKSVKENSFPYNAGSWKIKVYEHIHHILDDVLADFRIQHLSNVQNAFTALWPLKVLAEFIGLRHTYLTGGHSFLMVRHYRCHKYFEMSSIAPYRPVLDSRLVTALENITSEGGPSVFNFVAHFGSHYVRSFSAGAVVYQVFAFPTRAYECIKTQTPEFELEYLHKCVKKSAIHAGEIKILSNTGKTEERLNSQKKEQKHGLGKSVFEKQNIFYFKQNETLLFDLCNAENLAVTGFYLASISNVVRDPLRSISIREVIDNQMKLREIGL